MEAEEPTSAEEDGRGPETRRAALLRDGDGVYYFGDAARINDFLGVEHYAKAMPRIPLEELHASSVQHPRYPEYRYLLHTRRVPTMQTSGRDGAAEPVQKADVGGQALPRCAGVGVEESVVWICRECRDALCVKVSPSMPGPALANLMWGGREHPEYQDLSEATRTLLGRGRLVYQQVILKRGAPEEQPLGLAGNTIMLTQPKTSEIIPMLPPPREELTEGFAVLFTTGRQDVKKAKMLEVPREQYLRCARIRAEVCEPFCDVKVSPERAAELLPEQGVPDAFVQAALEVQEAECFHPTMTGPASMRIPDAPEEDRLQAEPEEGDANGDEGGPACHGDQDAVAEEHGELSGQIMAENLIGLDEAHVDDPGARFAVLQRKLQLLQKEARTLEQKEKGQRDAQEPPLEEQVRIEGQRELYKQVA